MEDSIAPFADLLADNTDALQVRNLFVFSASFSLLEFSELFVEFILLINLWARICASYSI